MARVVEFRPRYDVGTAATSGASRLDVLKGRCQEWFGQLLARLAAPGFVRDCEIADTVTGHTIIISTGVLFTKMTINGRDFYFGRLTGKYDGTGSSLEG